MKEFLRKYKMQLLLLLIAVLVILSYFFVYRFAFDGIVLLLIALAFILKKEKEFFRDWSIPVLLFYLYEFVRGKAYLFAEMLNRPLLNDVLVNWESRIFGKIPTVFLQYNLSNAEEGVFLPNWYDYLLFFFYVSFFVYWLGIGFLIWRKNSDLFKRYIYGLLGFSMVSAVIYIFFPSAPPWYASQVGILPPLERLMLSYDYFSAKYVTMVSTYGNNDFAAFPSLHAAWPFYVSLFAVGVWGKKALPLLMIPLIIAFATWYGAEHYVIDSIFGFALAGSTYLIVRKREPKY